MTNAAAQLPTDITVLERGWLSANNILFQGQHGNTLVDSGYCIHAEQTVDLVAASLAPGKSLDQLINTHLHSDHCGGNAALQARCPQLHTRIPPGQFSNVQKWDAEALGYIPTGQLCPAFRADDILQPGSEIPLGDRLWQVHAAPGHDAHAVILFEPRSRVLISGDALWENGFGVVFPEIEGEEGFDDVAATLDLIERLAPLTVIPGHGAVFADIPKAMAIARKRLDGFLADPARHAKHAAKVLLKYKLLEWQQIPMRSALDWLAQTRYFNLLHQNHFADQDASHWAESLIQDLIHSGVAARKGEQLLNV